MLVVHAVIVGLMLAVAVGGAAQDDATVVMLAGVVVMQEIRVFVTAQSRTRHPEG